MTAGRHRSGRVGTLRCATALILSGLLSTGALPRSATALDAGGIRSVEALVRHVSGDAGKARGGTGQKKRGPAPVTAVSEADLVAALEGTSLDAGQAKALWVHFAGQSAGPITAGMLRALIRASDTPQAREAMWNELGQLTGTTRKGAGGRANASLLGLFEQHRTVLLPLLAGGLDTEDGDSDIADLMLSSRMFGATVADSIAWVSEHLPTAPARRLEHERGTGRPVAWESAAFEGMLRWKAARYGAGAARAARSMAELDTHGFQFVTIFNMLHDLDPRFRKRMAGGLSPADVLNIVIGGEQELYRMGTSSYHGYLHDLIMTGIRESGSFEAFMEQATPRLDGLDPGGGASARVMIVLRVASSFGKLGPVLATVRSRDRLIAEAIAALGDPRQFETNALLVADVLTAPATDATVAFQKELRDHLYARYRDENGTKLRRVYGSMLSVYQTMSGDRRDPKIDAEFALDETLFRIPFARLFSGRGGETPTHRIFMRMDDDADATATYKGFIALMKARGATISPGRHYDLIRVRGSQRAVEIYANQPTAMGLNFGLEAIGKALAGRRVETVIGRGHTGIVGPLQESSRRLLGSRLKDVAVVMIGTCGGDASMRELMGTFGHKAFITTRATGRQAINNALIQSHVAALLTMPAGGRLSTTDVLAKAASWFQKQSHNGDLKSDAGFYRVSMAAVLVSILFEAHVRDRAASAPGATGARTPG